MGNRRLHSRRDNSNQRYPHRIKINSGPDSPSAHRSDIELIPSLYLLNAAALTKLHAIEHLAADLASYDADIAVITETHFKAKHSDTVVGIENYMCFIGVIEWEGEGAV